MRNIGPLLAEGFGLMGGKPEIADARPVFWLWGSATSIFCIAQT